MLKALTRWFAGPSHDDLPTIDRPPQGAVLKPIRARGSEPVTAELASRDGEIAAKEGALSYRAGRHYLLSYPNGDRAPVEKRIFELMYQPRADGRFEKRTDVVLHFFTLPFPVTVNTLEGARRAEAGDWIIRGVVDELYPVKAETAESKYEAA